TNRRAGPAKCAIAAAVPTASPISPCCPLPSSASRIAPWLTATAIETPAADAFMQRCAISRAAAGLSNTAMAMPSGASRMIRRCGAMRISATASAASSCARSLACSATGRRANSVTRMKTTLASAGAEPGTFKAAFEKVEMRGFYTQTSRTRGNRNGANDRKTAGDGVPALQYLSCKNLGERRSRTMTKDQADRRSFIKKTGLATLAAVSGISAVESRADEYRVPFSSGTEAPKLKAPAHACDCHMHFYDDRYPVASTATLRPPNSTIEDYRLLQKRIGTSRTVIATPSTYGTDNRPSLAAAAKLGSSARVVAVVDDTVTDAELKRLAGLGVCAIRFNLVQKGATTLEMLEPMAARVHALGWHVQIHMLGDQIVQIEELLSRLPAPIVFDHMGRVPQPAGIEHPAFRVILRLLERERAWVKVSGAYHDTKVGPPGYGDTSAVGRAFVKAAPERVVWGTDWPHPTVKELANKPDDAILFDLLADWAPDSRTLRKILVENPAALYGFE